MLFQLRLTAPYLINVYPQVSKIGMDGYNHNIDNDRPPIRHEVACPFTHRLSPLAPPVLVNITVLVHVQNAQIRCA